MYIAFKAMVILLPVTRRLCRCNVQSNPSTNAANGTLEQVPTTMLKPEGTGPFPAVVIMHDCSGLGPRSSGAPIRWARELVERGYVIVMPDSFTARGHAGGVCTNASASRNEVAPARRVDDAYAALAYLRTLPYVDGSRMRHHGRVSRWIVDVGFAGGAGTGNGTASSREADGFQRGNSSHPGCAASPGGWRSVRQAGGSAVPQAG